MKKRILCLSLAMACAAASSAMAAGKLYRWVDAEGKVHYSDTVPPSQVDLARDKLNAQGRRVESVQRAMTPEEQAVADAEAKAEEERLKAKQAEEHMDNVLMSSYEEEADLKRAYDERFDLSTQSIESAKVGIGSQERSLAELLAHAANLERTGKPVSDAIKKSIELSRSQVAQQTDYLSNREAERALLQKEFDETLARYRRLKADAAAGADK